MSVLQILGNVKLFRQNYVQGLDLQATMSEVLAKIEEKEIFGVVECNIHAFLDNHNEF